MVTERVPERGGRVPPQDVDAERSVLGAMMLDRNAMTDAIELLSPEDFYRPAYAKTFEAIIALFDRNEPVDEITVGSELKAQGHLEAVGGAAGVAMLTESVPTAANAAHYARIVRSHALTRRLISASTTIAASGYEGHADIDVLLDEAEAKIFEITRAREHRSFVPVKEVVKEAFKRIEKLYERKEAVTGISTGFLDLDRLTSGFQPSDLIIVAGRPSMGKCLAAATEIVQADGSMATIEQMFRRKSGRLLTLRDDWRIGQAQPSAYVDDGIKPLFRVTTRLGRRVDTTLTHPFLTFSGWRPLAELRVGDRIAVPRRLPVSGRDRLADGRAEVLGYLLGDGCLTKGCPELTNNDARIRDDFLRSLASFSGVRGSLSTSGGTRAVTVRVASDPEYIDAERKAFARRLVREIRRTGLSYRAVASAVGVSPASVTHWTRGQTVPSSAVLTRVCSLLEVNVQRLAPDGVAPLRTNGKNTLTLWLESLGTMGRAARDKTAPEVVFTLCRDQLAAFLNRLFATDGWATVLASGQPQIGLASVSERLIRQVQHLLLRFGIVAAVKERSVRYQGTRRPVWQLDLTDSRSLRTFCDEIGIFSKEAAVDAVRRAVDARRQETNRDLIPIAIWNRIAALKGTESWASFGRRAGFASTSNIHVGRRAMTRKRLHQIATALGSAELAQLAESDVYWDEVVAIEPLGKGQVYDLTIPETHNFVAADICVHNTAVALNIAQNAAVRAQIPVAVFSLEMSKEQLVTRMLCSEGRIDGHRLRGGFLKESDWPRLARAAGTLAEAPVYIDDTAALSILEMRAKARRLQADKGLGMIVVDYLQLMRGRAAAEGREREISEISRGLKALAKELNVPVVALSQLNRSLEQRTDKRPMLSDLRESGAIEQDADVIIFVYRDEYYNPDSEAKGLAEIIVGKQRNGPTDTVMLKFFKEYTRFENYSPEQ